jgi:hypothetical protein
MPGFLLHVGAEVQCAHAGRVTPMTANPRVMVSGQATQALSPPWGVAACTMPPPSAGNGPCVTAQWLMGSTRVMSLGQPLLLQTSQATCAPTGTPVAVLGCQTHVAAL